MLGPYKAFLIRPKTAPVKQNLHEKIHHIWSLSINFKYSNRKSQSQQKLAE